MGRNPNSKNKRKIKYQEVETISNNLIDELDNDPRYSLEIDPLNIYNFSPFELDFIQYMIEYKNVKFVATILMNIELDEGLELYKKYAIKQEIKRISLALFARRFKTKMADLDALGGYLTTAITDEFVPEGEKLSPKDKLEATRLLMKINQIKMDMIDHPEVVDVSVIEADIKNLKTNDIKQLISNEVESAKDKEKKEEIISELDPDDLLSTEEKTYLRSSPLSSLEKLKEEIKIKTEEKNGKED